MRNAQMKDALVKAIDPQLAKIGLKKVEITNQPRWNHNFRSHNLLKRYIKKTLQEHIFTDTN